MSADTGRRKAMDQSSKVKNARKAIGTSAHYPEIPKGKPWGSEDGRKNSWPINLRIPRTSLGDFKRCV
jgi:hypothetical protein